MCGIVGLINYDGLDVSFSSLKRMTNAISHRGPDGEGHWHEDGAGFGHRRLAIIDLSVEARQPMISSDQRYIPDLQRRNL
jgi:asparagine synthase (glutamine-hydrolysing)